MSNSFWNTFDSVRSRQASQYERQVFPADTGFDVETLEREIRRHIAEHVEEPRIKLRAAMFAFLLENARIRVDAFDWFADHIDAGCIMTKIREEWRNEFAGSAHYDLWDLYLSNKDGSGFSCLDLSHTSPGWTRLLKYGICGIRDEAMAALAAAKDDSQKEFLSSVATVYEAIRKYILRLAAEAKRVGAEQVVDCLESIARRPPQSFHEALQLSFIYNQMQEIEGENVRTQGTFDQLYVKGTDVYGGAVDAANPKGSQYSLQGAGTEVLSSTLTLDKSSSYFGMWWSAGDPNNKLEFYEGSKLVASFTTASLMGLLPDTYYGNPKDRSMDRSEAFGFINFFGDPTTTWDKVVLSNNNYSGFESDNYTTRVTAWNPLVDGVLPGVPVALVNGSTTTKVTAASLAGTNWSMGASAVGAAPGAPAPPVTLLAAFAGVIALRQVRTRRKQKVA